MVVIEYGVTPAARSAAIRSAADAVRAGQLVVLPTDTVYGVGCDPFDAAAVGRLLRAKGRGRDKPSPVLVADLDQAKELAADIPDLAMTLIDKFWPGPLTLVLPAKQLGWDLGETGGTVALRMPDDPVALELLRSAGPLAVSSANLTAMHPAATAEQAAQQLGEKVAVYIDAGLCGGGTPSTVVGFQDVRGAGGEGAGEASGAGEQAGAGETGSGAADALGAGEVGARETIETAAREPDARASKPKDTLRIRILREGAVSAAELESFADVVMP